MLVKEGFKSYFSSFSKEVFIFCNKIFKNWKVIKNDYKHLNTNKIISPFKYIKSEFVFHDSDDANPRCKKNTPKYILDFIEKLESDYKTKREEVNEIINTEKMFIDEIEVLLKYDIDMFFDDDENEYIF
jgi:hypothetical protein